MKNIYCISQVFFCVVAVWVAGAGAAAPILFNMKLKVERSVKITSSHHKLSCDCLQVEALPARAVELLGVESRLYCFEEWGSDQVLLQSSPLMTSHSPT